MKDNYTPERDELIALLLAPRSQRLQVLAIMLAHLDHASTKRSTAGIAKRHQRLANRTKLVNSAMRKVCKALEHWEAECPFAKMIEQNKAMERDMRAFTTNPFDGLF